MPVDNETPRSRGATVLAVASVMAAMIVLAGMTFIPIASWIPISYALMIAFSVLATILGVRQWPHAAGKRATIVAIVVLAFALFLFVWGGATTTVTQPS